jgi:uncharacterized protein YhhL (DUF1145 family)
MSRRSQRIRAKASQPIPVPKPPIAVRLARWIVHWPRPVRIVVTLVFALAVTLAFSPLIDDIYLRYFFHPSTRVVPSLVSVFAGLCMYVAGWLLVVGTVDGELPSRLAVLLYGVFGLLAISAVLVMLVFGWTTGNNLG